MWRGWLGCYRRNTAISANIWPKRTWIERGVMTRTIAIVAMQDVQLLDVSGPLDVFAEANVQSGGTAYRLRIVAGAAGPIRSSSGVRLIPDDIIGSAMAEPIDTLLVAGSPSASVVRPDRHVVDWLREIAPVTRRYGSVCAGAFLLAETGLLTAGGSPRTGRSPNNSRRAILRCASRGTRSMSGMDRCGPRQVSPRGSIWLSPWSRRIWGGLSPWLSQRSW